MRLDRVTVVAAPGAAPLTEAGIAELLAPRLADLPAPPRMVIDARPPAARIGATATYRLLAALDLRHAAPVAIRLPPDVEGAYHALDALLAICPDGGPALVVTGTAPPGPAAVGWCTATVSPSRSPDTADLIHRLTLGSTR